eukprot:7031616-Prymnesium_polylepis.1
MLCSPATRARRRDGSEHERTKQASKRADDRRGGCALLSVPGSRDGSDAGLAGAALVRRGDRARYGTLRQIVQLDHAPRQPHGHLATQEARDLDERALPLVELRALRLGGQQQAEPRVERRLERDARLR